MEFSPAVDMGAGALTYLLGVTGLALWGIPAFLLEGMILRWRQVAKRPFLASFVMNLVSTIAGYAAAGLLLTTFQGWALALLGQESNDLSLTYFEVGPHTTITFVFIILISWALSILIEGGILGIMEKNLPKDRAWKTVFIANIASYILPVAFIFIWLATQSTAV